MNADNGLDSIVCGCYDVGMVWCSPTSRVFTCEMLTGVYGYGVDGVNVIIRIVLCKPIGGVEAALWCGEG